jgi:hypothetical protein
VMGPRGRAPHGLTACSAATDGEVMALCRATASAQLSPLRGNQNGNQLTDGFGFRNQRRPSTSRWDVLAVGGVEEVTNETARASRYIPWKWVPPRVPFA